jgi:uncharacterized protein
MPSRFRLDIKPSKIDGTGAYALERIPGKRKIGHMDGDIISLRDARKKASGKKRVSIVEFGDGRALDAGKDTQLRFINHSCAPNTYMRVAYDRVEFYSLRKIMAGEELTCDYGPTHHDGKLKCRCGAINCRGFL